MRGYEMTQGLVIAVDAVVVTLLVILLSYGIIKETLTHSIIGVAVLVAFRVVASVVADVEEVKMPSIVHVFLAVLGGIVARPLLDGLFPEAQLSTTG